MKRQNTDKPQLPITAGGMKSAYLLHELPLTDELN